MGIFTQNIAKESKSPTKVSLANNPNYVQFESTGEVSNPPTENKNKQIDIRLTILSTSLDADKCFIPITEEATEIDHSIKATRNRNEVNNNTFFLDSSASTTAENIRYCLMKDSFFNGNFDITVPPIAAGSNVINGSTIRIVSKRIGSTSGIRLTDLNDLFIRFTDNSTTPPARDSISGALDDPGNCEIEIDIYQDTNVFLGVADKTTLGTPVVSLAKAYFNNPIWFDINSIWGNQQKYSNSFLHTDTWCDAGTATDYRFVAKRSDGKNRESFYISDVLYTLSGYNRNLDNADLTDYVYDTTKKNNVKPLTRQPILPHVKGQSQYFNFVLSDPDRNNITNEYNMGIRYELKTQSGSNLGYLVSSMQNRKKFSIVNTIRLDIDNLLETHAQREKIGIVEVYLSKDGNKSSEPLTFNILPESLYKVNDFAFLNSMGGWSSFNFSGTEETDFRTSTNTLYKTQTPAYSISSDIESVYTKEVSEQFIVQTMPIKAHIAKWLKELSASPAVYELSTKRYVIVDELNIKPNSKDDLFALQMKYHYSDSYNGSVKG